MSPEDRWQAAWRELDLTPPAGLLGRVLAQLESPARHYHNLAHVTECLDWLERARDSAANYGQVAIALWFHDAIYDSREEDSEVLSARWAERALVNAGASPDIVAAVTTMVLATTHRDEPPPGDPTLICDIDLAILGSPPERFALYDRGIRAEYQWVPENEYRKARMAVLSRFLARPAIYRTPFFHERLERQARLNLAAAIRDLTSEP